MFDANLASLKSNQCVERKINYNLKPQANKMIAKVNINYKNNCDFTWKSTRYRTYTRTYVPLNSKLIKTTGAMEIDRSNKTGKTDVYNEFDKTVFGAFISIEPKKSGTLSFEYELPENISKKIFNSQNYNLIIQKQAGTLADDLKINLEFPNKLKTATPGEDRRLWNDKKYNLSTDLKIDREVNIGF